MIGKENLTRVDEYLYEILQSFRSDMRVPARIYASDKMLGQIFGDRSLEQLVNVTTLPGIMEYALAMPDVHEGYGFPIGGVAAMDLTGGVISPGAIGYDVNCGLRLLLSEFRYEEIRSELPDVATQIQRDVPSGVGRGGRIKLDSASMDGVLAYGSKRVMQQGYGEPQDLEHCEEKGTMANAQPDWVSKKAKTRGRDQLGTLGAGNHFLEIQKVEMIYESETAKIFGLFPDQISVMIHCGSRGLGHQVCTDYVKMFLDNIKKYDIKLVDNELACGPITSEEGKKYFGAMAAAANFAWANRHVIAHLVRGSLKKIFKRKIPLTLLYDVAHNIGKFEEHVFDNKNIKVCVHRKGATRAFEPDHPDLPEDYRKAGQPVIIPGSMGTASYVLVGTKESMEKSFGTVCHGAGRAMSRRKARRTVRGSELRTQLEQRGIIVRCTSNAGLAEEAPQAYKDIDNVVEVIHGAGLAKKVARLVPVAVVKG
jgi:tRNA-splicing ligase RtcB